MNDWPLAGRGEWIVVRVHVGYWHEQSSSPLLEQQTTLSASLVKMMGVDLGAGSMNCNISLRCIVILGCRAF